MLASAESKILCNQMMKINESIGTIEAVTIDLLNSDSILIQKGPNWVLEVYKIYY